MAPTNASGGDQSRPAYIGLTAHSLGNGQTVLDMQPGFHTIVNLSTWVHRGSSVHLGLFNRCIDSRIMARTSGDEQRLKLESRKEKKELLIWNMSSIAEL